MRRYFIATILVVVLGLSLGTAPVLADGAMIASYTLNNTPVDGTGRNPNATLINTPYEDGGVYLNGNYVGVDPDSSMMQTPGLMDLDFSALSVRVEFKVGELPAWDRPIIYCGSSWRWMGVHLNRFGEVYLTCNTAGVPGASQPVALDTWYTLVITWDGTAGHLFLDGVEITSKVFTPNFGNDRRITSQDGGNGTAFKGHLRNLAVYNGVISRVVGASDVVAPLAANTLRNYPNPFNPSTTIVFSLETPARTSLEVFDLTGRLLATLIEDELLGEGPHGRLWNGTDLEGRHLPSGMYFCRFQAGDFMETRRMTLVK